MAISHARDLAPTAPPAASSRPHAARLGGDVVLVSWDVPQAPRAPAALRAAGLPVAPTASLRLRRRDGGARLVWVLRRPAGRGLLISLHAGAAGPVREVDLDGDLPALDPADLLRGLDPEGGVAIVSAMVNVWAPLFRLEANRAFAAALRHVLLALAPRPKPAAVLAKATEDLVLLGARLPERVRRIEAIHVVGSAGIVRLAGDPHLTPAGPDGALQMHVLAEAAALPDEAALLAVTGPGGLSVRLLPDPRSPGRAPGAVRRPPGLVAWLRERGEAAPVLRQRLLTDLAARSEAGRAVAVEAQLRAPLAPKRLAGGLATLSAEILTAVATPAGLLVAGRWHDPLEQVAGLEATGPDGATIDLTPGLHRFPTTLEGPRGPVQGEGFAALSPGFGGAPLLQPRFRLRLRSGAHHVLVPEPQPADPVEARALVLRAVPPQHVTDALLADVLGPVIASLQGQVLARVGAPRIRRYGEAPARPRASVVIPLYKVMDFLRFQVAAFAGDPWFRANAELVFVLDSPHQAPEVEHLLGGLHLVHGLPMTLAVMERNGGFARACNAGAGVARGDAVALVNSDVIPTSPGWLEALVSRLEGDVGMVGPKLLFEDGSIQHAGMYFSRDHQGRWLNHHFHKGLPRDYAPARRERAVPAVTGACVVLPRMLFQEVGGFTEDYVIGDYEDSDLCLKVTSLNRSIMYVPDVELYHLERKSMSQSVDYMQGIAWQYNCALHAERWSDVMTSIMQAGVTRRAVGSPAR